MAVARLGMIITEMAGSIGGTTIKRQGGNLSIYNKSRGANKSILYQNKGLGRMNDVRARWRSSTNSYKNGWNTRAESFTFPDRFGNQKYITGYQLYTKSSNARALVELEPMNASGYDQNIYGFYAKDFSITKSSLQCRITVVQGSGRQYYLFGFDVLCKPYSKPIFNNRIALDFFEWDDVGDVNLDEVFWRKYGYLEYGDTVRIYITPMNPPGYKGVTQYLDTTVE